ncbi:deoxycytidylate deaminase [Candidatus Methanomassiliicoccus intestinalis]|jgi:CMP/dCMP deaminase zinc-binding protein|uniref:dCMP deaminase Late competence protein ComEB n=2 Tax=Candidatus Methanomassiliicoccus intestinalis TaxID=1406512 RepID=R9T6X8_METII|nr:cytidine/deoxycytidylate deaminase family protein [Candidatus Methanomassiliicoccus intestinalis]AGN25421.1 dCMP deaminase; Late competence protein ComEB [Candidatus Methanomassiliicoccus intestinalis Issoire-Mx1]TQS81743.1 MAG: cytidine deaminase [Candidatus Methanomassiliicoccus intestinalis]TQS84315.1 MAG: cytidine deaminase [Candidatus Methanomassiliicoccus intestinalis]
MATRPDNDAYFMNMAKLSATRSTCLRRSVGAVIVKEKRILTTGYNGAPRGIKHCEETGCVRLENHIESGTRHELCRGVHAEQNAVIQAAYFGVSVKDASIYITNFPCVLCAKILINAGIKEVIYLDDYVDTLSREILEESNVLVRRYVENK